MESTMKRPNLSRPKVGIRSRRNGNSVQAQHHIDEDDSGLGDTTHFDESSSFSTASQFSENNVSMSERPCVPNSSGSLPRAYHSASTMVNKRLRLDIPEEANELPEQTFVGETAQQLTSFTNVPALLSPISHLFSPAIDAVAILDETPLRRKNSRQEKVTKKGARRAAPDGIPAVSSDGKIEIRITAPPEKQHRARYQTEGSRGSVKGEGSSGHPVVKILGCHKPCVVECFVASNEGPVVPHMFYQACQVNGKNSTPCEQSKQDGVTFIKMTAHPDNHMTIICDCVGILKERNVDVEQRLKSSFAKGRKKNTKCRLVFRTIVELESGMQETIQVASDSICCSQPSGVPEISRKSIEQSAVEGGGELYIVGKHFLKNTKVIFRQVQGGTVVWEQTEEPDKDFGNSGYLICSVPRYARPIDAPVQVQLIVSSDNKQSEPHMFEYVPGPIGDSSKRMEPKGQRSYLSSIGNSGGDATHRVQKQTLQISKEISSLNQESITVLCEEKLLKSSDSPTSKFLGDVLSLARLLKQTSSMDSESLKDLSQMCGDHIMAAIRRYVNASSRHTTQSPILVGNSENANIPSNLPKDSIQTTPIGQWQDPPSTSSDPETQFVQTISTTPGTQTKQVVPETPMNTKPCSSKDVFANLSSEDISESSHISWQPPELVDALNPQDGYHDFCQELNGLKCEFGMFNRDCGASMNSTSNPADNETQSDQNALDTKVNTQDPVLPQFNHPEILALKFDSSQFLPGENLSLDDLPADDIIDYFPLDMI